MATIKIKSVDNDSSTTVVLSKSKGGGKTGSIYRGCYVGRNLSYSFESSLTVPEAGDDGRLFLQTANAGYSINYTEMDDVLSVTIAQSGNPANTYRTTVHAGKKYELEISSEGEPSLRDKS